MPLSSFRLKSTIGRTYKTDFDDTLRTKEALRDLEYYDEPSYGMTGYPDEGLFKAIEAFQADHGLKRDGIMKPGGETASAMKVQLASLLRDTVSDEDPSPLPGVGTDDTQIAASGARPVPSGPSLPFGPALDLGKKLQRWWGGNQWPDPSPANENKRSIIAEPLPKLPPSRPMPAPYDNKTEFPVMPPENPTMEGKPSEPIPNDPLIFQALSEELRRELTRPLESHRGNPLTQRGNRRWVEIGLETFELWKPRDGESFEHTAGSYDKDGNYLKEDYLRNIETGGRKESSNADATFKYRFANNTERKLYLNTGRMRKDGVTGIAWEDGSIKRLVRNAGEDAAELAEKLLPGMDEAEWEERARKKWIEIHTRMMGRPPSKKY